MQEIIYFLPGQGAETPSLGKKLFEKFPLSFNLLNLTEKIWGFDLREIILNGSDNIYDIIYCQPILCWYGYSLGLALKEKYKIKILVPYSLGVFPSIALAEILPFEDIIKILKFNFDLVNKLDLSGKLLYVSGYPIEEAKKNLKGIYFSSINHPLSYTIGGKEEEIKEAYNFLKEKAFSLKILPSPWPIHTKILKEVSEELKKEEYLWKNLKDPTIPILSPIDISLVDNKDKGKFLLSSVISKPMFFNSICKKLKNEKIKFIEASESGFFQKIFKLHNRDIKIFEGIGEI